MMNHLYLMTNYIISCYQQTNARLLVGWMVITFHRVFEIKTLTKITYNRHNSYHQPNVILSLIAYNGECDDNVSVSKSTLLRSAANRNKILSGFKSLHKPEL
jgi:hypothetical protein